MRKRIKIIVPVATSIWNEPTLREIEKYKDSETSLDIINLQKGPESIEGSYDEVWSAIFTLQEVEKAAKEGYDGIIIYCYGDPALRAAKEAVEIPVVGLGEASAIFALLLGHKFGILTVGPPESDAGAYLMDNLKMYELDHKCVDVLSIGVPVVDLKEGDEKERSLVIELGRGLIEKGADVIILGCGSILGVAEAASCELGIPVIIPAAAALKMCEAMISMGVAQSKKGFYPPAAKKRIM
ncbi:MAG: aspartate/glutamate racemase family protein [Atribacterota bacterium]